MNQPPPNQRRFILLNSRSITLLAICSIGALGGFSCAERHLESGRSVAQDRILAEIIIAEDIRALTPELEAALYDTSSLVRSRAVRALGRIGPGAAGGFNRRLAQEMIWPYLRDTSAEVSSMAAFSLGLLGKDSLLANRLVEFSFTAPLAPAQEAIIAAGRCGDSANYSLSQKLAILLNHRQPGFRSRAAIAMYLSQARSMSDALVQVALNDSIKTVRDTALYSLVRLRESRAKDVYLSFLDDPNPYLQSLALQGVALVGDTTLVGAAIERLDSDDPNLRSSAISALTKLACRESEIALASVIDNEDDERLISQALEALGKVNPQRYSQMAVNQLSEDNSLGLRAAIVSTLARAYPLGNRRLLDSLLTHGDRRLMSYFFEALNQELATAAFEKVVMDHLPGSDGPAHYAAFAALKEKGGKPPNWMTADSLLTLFEDGADMVIKSAIVEYAGERREPWFLEVALTIVRANESDATLTPPSEILDTYRSILTAVKSYAQDKVDELDRQSQINIREIIEHATRVKDIVVSREAGELLSELFEVKRPKVYQAEPRWTAAELAELLREAQRDFARAQIIFADDTTRNVAVELALDYDSAPLTCLNFVELANSGFYEGVVFHRIIPNFVAQGGDPRGDGWGGPGYAIRCEYSRRKYQRGAVGMATSGRDTGGSQFFVTLSSQPHLEARYTVFALVTEGMERLDKVRQGDTAVTIRVLPADN